MLQLYISPLSILSSKFALGPAETATGVHFHVPLLTRREREALSTPSTSPPEEESPLDVEGMSYDSLDEGYDQIHNRVVNDFTLNVHDFEYRPDNNFEYSRNDNLVNVNDNFGTQFQSTWRDRDLNESNDRTYNDVNQSSDDPAVRMCECN